MNELQSMKDCISDHLTDSELDELSNCKTWLEGWICGVTDPILTTNSYLKDDAMHYLQTVYDNLMK